MIRVKGKGRQSTARNDAVKALIACVSVGVVRGNKGK